MESFGLFNFLKSVFFPSPASGSESPSSAASSRGDSPAQPNLFDPAALFGKLRPQPPASGETAAPQQNAAPAPPPAPPAESREDGGNNPFLALMERHERAVRNIDRRSPR